MGADDDGHHAPESGGTPGDSSATHSETLNVPSAGPESPGSSTDSFQELAPSTPAPESPAMVPIPDQSHPLSTPPHLDSSDGTSHPRQTVMDDNQTLAALAASSASSPHLPSGAAFGVEPAETDPNTPSFILVASLRSQITDLTSQVTSLNSKLVSSYTRIGDLEDDMHETRNERSMLHAKLAELEKDKKKWEKEIEIGGWVERDHVQGELQTLMHKVLDETRSRETAVQAHDKLEAEIESLTSSLFSEANKMVAVERFARARAEEKMRALEESNTVMEGMLGGLQENLREKVEKLEANEAEMANLKNGGEASASEPDQIDEDHAQPAKSEEVLFSDGKTVIRKSPSFPSRPSMTPTSRSFINPRQLILPPRLNTSVLPYNEFIAFVTYLRQLRVTVLARPPPEHYSPYSSHAGYQPSRSFGSMAPPPSSIGLPPPPSPATLLAPHLPLSSHSSQPFVKRCVDEDSDPAIRLDLAPGLGFLSRRTVGTAILDGTLLIEPTYSGSTLPSSTCALCGAALDRWWTGGELPTPAAVTKANVNQTMRKVLGGTGGWGISPFNRSSTPPLVNPPPSQSHSDAATSIPFPTLPQHQIHIFRVNDTSTARYAICPTYCLPRLRAVCEFWGYVRAMEKGLLLEEGFHFVGGSALSESRNGSQTSLGLSKSKSSVALGAGEAGHSTSALGGEGPVPVDRKVVEPVTVVVDIAEEDSATKKSLEKAREDLEKVNEEKAEMEAEEQKSDAAAPSSPLSMKNDTLTPTSPRPDSAPSSPTATHNSAAKPPVPKRSDRRGLTTPTLGSSPTESRSTSPIIASAVPPKLPPRRAVSNPSPASAAGTTSMLSKSIAAGAKASEMGGTVDAMEIVGGATGWEDRCWGEVVRLKEAVFWTRMAREQEAV